MTNDKPAEMLEEMEKLYFDEQELLMLSIDQDYDEDDPEHHTYAADFRVGFRYGFTRGKRACYNLLQSRVTALEARLKIATEALEFYGSEISWEWHHNASNRSEVDKDEGKRARAAIAAIQPARKEGEDGNF